LLLGCQVAEPPRKHLVVSGSPSLTPLAQDIAQRFEQIHPGSRIDIAQAPATGNVIDETRQGLVDVALMGRALRASETDLRGTVLGQDGLAFVVHGSNPVAALDERQVVNLLTHSYTDWREVGGSPGPVTLFGVADGVDLREALLLRFGLVKTSVRLDALLYRNDQVIEAVANNPSALGYVSLAAALKPASVQTIRLLSVGQIQATVENVSNGLYPYTRPLMLVSRLQNEELAQKFIDFASSVEVHDLIAKHGFAAVLP